MSETNASTATATGRTSQTFEDFNTAARFRTYLQRVVHRELDKRYPGDRYGFITGIDYDRMFAYVLFEGEDVPIPIPFPASCQPTEIFQRVRISGERGDRYISAISNGAAVTDPGDPPVGGFTPNFTNATLSNNWESYGGAYAPPGYRRTADGRVLLRGVLVNPIDGTTGDIAFTLPTGYRPEYKVLIGNVSDAFDAPNRIEIAATGGVTVWGLTWVSLDGITFDAFA